MISNGGKFKVLPLKNQITKKVGNITVTTIKL